MRIDGYNIYRSPTAGGEYELAGSIGFKEVSIIKNVSQVFDHEGRPNAYIFTDADGGDERVYYQVRPYSGDQEATDGNENLLFYNPDSLLAASDLSDENIFSGSAGRDDEVGLLKDELIVNFNDSATLEQMINAVYSTGIGASIAGRLTEGNGFQLKTIGNVEDMDDDRTGLADRTGVESVEFNYLLPAPDLGHSVSFANPEPDATEQWNLETINAPDAWDYGEGAGIGVGGEGSLIALIDTGIDTDHPEFAGKIHADSIYIDGRSTNPGHPDESANIEDTEGHGTAIAGLCAAAHNGVGMSGVAFDADLLIIKTGFKKQNGKWYMPATSIAEGIYYAVARNVTVIHISNAVTSDPGTAVHRAIEYAVSNNIPVVCPAGDYAADVEYYYPASFTETITVGATNVLNGKAGFTNYGNVVDIAAPGHLVYSANISGAYQTYSKTSISSAQVAGGVAMARVVDPTSSPSGIRALLRDNVTPLDPLLGLGTGIINLGAMMMNVPSVNRTLLAPNPVTITPGNGELSLDWPTPTEPEVLGYYVYRDTTSGFEPTSGNRIQSLFGIEQSQWTDETVENGRTYYYIVESYGENNNRSIPTDEASGIPWPGITGLALAPGDPGSITATWDDVADGEPYIDEYNVYYNDSDDFAMATLTEQSPYITPEAVISGLENGTTYYVWVTMLGEGSNESDPCDPEDITVGASSPPENVLATDGTSYEYCEVTWDEVIEATGYNVYRADDESGTNEVKLNDTLLPAGTTAYQDATGVLNQHYWYCVTSYNGWESEAGLYDEGWRFLDAPTDLTASDGARAIYTTVSWTGVAEADDYAVFRSDDSAGPYTEIVSSTSGNTTYNDTTGELGTHYFYTAKAKFEGGYSGYSNYDEGWRSLNAPANVDATDGTYMDKTVVTWDAAADADDYSVWRSDSSGGPYTELASTTSGATYYDDTTGTLNTHYWYAVKTKMGETTSALSAEDEGWRLLSVPGNLVASDGTYTDHTEITWDAVAEADDYSVWRDDSSGGPYTEIASTTGGLTTYNDSSGDMYVHYWYTVRSKSGGVSSEFANEDEGWYEYYSDPVADLQADPTSGEPPLTVNFDASASHDPDDGDNPGDGIVNYEFDFSEGAEWQDYDLNASPPHTYNDGGTYTAKVRVTDNDEATDTDSVTITVAGTWYIETVDSAAEVGKWNSIALDSQDKPHISYLDWINNDLKYAYYNGTSWQFVSIDTDGIVGEYTSIAVDLSDNPHISCYDSGRLRYAHYNGSSWNIEMVDGSANVGWFTSIALDSSDNPHIAYRDHSNSDLKYAYYDGSSWQIETIDSVGNVGYYISIALDSSEYPHVSYRGNGLKYAYMDVSGWHIETIDSEGDVGTGTSIELDSGGYPHVSYRDETWDDLKYSYMDASGWHIETVDSGGDVGLFTSIALDSSGNPHISYYDATNTALKYAYWE